MPAIAHRWGTHTFAVRLAGSLRIKLPVAPRKSPVPPVMDVLMLITFLSKPPDAVTMPVIESVSFPVAPNSNSAVMRNFSGSPGAVTAVVDVDNDW